MDDRRRRLMDLLKAQGCPCRQSDARAERPARLQEIAALAPAAWNVATSPHKAAVFEALLSLQARFKLLRFDYDPQDGEIRPNVELP
ncbi:MAG: hypothetical protein ACKOHG_04345, partial [Planctomycetia bacterium]